MIKTILIQDFRTYKGSNEIHLNENFHLLADVAPPPSGQPPVLDALAIASGRSDFGDEDTDSAVGVTLRDGSTFRRCASGPCMVNLREVNLQEYKEEATRALQMFFVDWSPTWGNKYQQRQELLKCIEDFELPCTDESGIPTGSNQSFSSSFEAASKRATRCKNRMNQVSEALKLAGVELDTLQHVQEARSKCQMYRKSLVLHEMSRSQFLIESSSASLQTAEKALEAERQKFTENSEKSKETSTELAQLEDEIVLRRNENGEIESRILAITAGRSVLQCKDSYMEKWNEECLTLENNATKAFSARVELLKKSIHKSLVAFNDLDRPSQQKMLLDIYEMYHALDRVQSEYVAENAELEEKLSIVMKEMKFTNDHLSAQKILKQEFQPRFENEEQKGKEESIKAHLNKEPRTMESDIESLKLLYPGILGTLKDFVTARQDVVDTPIGGAIETILRKVATCKNDLTLVVCDDHKANEYSRTSSTCGSQPLRFVPREEPDVHPVAESVPLEIAEEYPSACCLSSLLATKSHEEEHLKYLLACRYLILPSPEACARVAEFTSWGLCSSDGTHYRTPTNWLLEASAVGVVVGDDAEEEEIPPAQRQTDARSRHYRIAMVEKRLQEVNQEMAYLEDYLDKWMVVYNRLRKLYDRVIDAKKWITVKMKELRKFREELKTVHLDSAKLRFPMNSGEMELSILRRKWQKWQKWCKNMGREFVQANVEHQSGCPPTTVEGDPPQPTLPKLSEYVASEVAKEAASLIEGEQELAKMCSRRDQYKSNLELCAHQHEVLKTNCDKFKRRISQAEHDLESYQEGLENMMRAEGPSLAPSPMGDSEYDESSVRQQIQENLVLLNCGEDIGSIDAKIKACSDELQRKILDCEQNASHAADDDSLENQIQSLREDYEQWEKEKQESSACSKRAQRALALLRKKRRPRVLQNVTSLNPVFARVYRDMYDHAEDPPAQPSLTLVKNDNVAQGLSIESVSAGRQSCSKSQLSVGERAIEFLALQVAMGIVSGCKTIAIAEADALLDSEAASEMRKRLHHLAQTSNISPMIILVTQRS